jgi:hypothetical protein
MADRTSLTRGQLRASRTCTEPSSGAPLTKEQTSKLLVKVELRQDIKDFFKRSTAALKVGAFHLCMTMDIRRHWSGEGETWEGKQHDADSGAASPSASPFLSSPSLCTPTTTQEGV